MPTSKRQETRGGTIPTRKTPSAPITLVAKGALLHRQLYTVLKEQIVSGRYRAGDKLPTQEDLCRQFSVSRITVRRALGDLDREGLIRNEQGVGAFVTVDADRIRQEPSFGLIGDMRRTLRETTMRLVSLEFQRCPAPIATALRLADGEQALHVVRTRSKADRPLMLLDGWIPRRFAQAVTAKALKTTSMHELIAGSFEALGRVVQEVNATLADPIVAKALEIEVNSAALRIDRLVHNRASDPVHYLTVWTAPHRTRLFLEVEAEDIEGYNLGRFVHDVRK